MKVWLVYQPSGDAPPDVWATGDAAFAACAAKILESPRFEGMLAQDASLTDQVEAMVDSDVIGWFNDHSDPDEQWVVEEREVQG